MYNFLFHQKYGQISCWGKKLLIEDEKRGLNAYFSPIGLKYAYFFPNWLKIYKITKKTLTIFRLRCAQRHYNDILWGKKCIKKGGVGKNMNFTFYYTPALFCFYSNYFRLCPEVVRCPAPIAGRGALLSGVATTTARLTSISTALQRLRPTSKPTRLFTAWNMRRNMCTSKTMQLSQFAARCLSTVLGMMDVAAARRLPPAVFSSPSAASGSRTLGSS